LIDVHREELDKMAAEMSGSKLEMGAYLSCYGKAMKNLDGSLDEETQEKYQTQAKRWTELKPPPQQQQWYV
jgi:hypothetical protein